MVVTVRKTCIMAPERQGRRMRWWMILASFLLCASALAQEDKKTDHLKPADPDTGESTVQETTLGLLPFALHGAVGCR
jgi:hypothetical protein